jgi:phenylacetic acid degradation operon negative regulatory protein
MRPQLRPWHGHWTTLIVTSVGTDPRTRAALRTTLHHKRFGELREGVWMRPDNLELDVDIEIRARMRIVQARDDAPAELAGQLWDLPSWAGTGQRLVAEMSRAGDVPARFVVAAAIVRHLLTDPVLPDELLPSDWPGMRLRTAYNDFAAELLERRDGIRLVEAT